ncbi:hypothetical protein PI124_g9745 [Phytophthora idaei]|nr:hypothetical protein PI125_g22801 [Phytophthora idaei]KAG3129230.1 hypothetical protein PI126_g21058 [Phytophthora idaei]KAG3245500.1 hypothetical protein PI124_g9745 [Phytophthora idaei]
MRTTTSRTTHHNNFLVEKTTATRTDVFRLTEITATSTVVPHLTDATCNSSTTNSYNVSYIFINSKPKRMTCLLRWMRQYLAELGAHHNLLEYPALAFRRQLSRLQAQASLPSPTAPTHTKNTSDNHNLSQPRPPRKPHLLLWTGFELLGRWFRARGAQQRLPDRQPVRQLLCHNQTQR